MFPDMHDQTSPLLQSRPSVTVAIDVETLLNIARAQLKAEGINLPPSVLLRGAELERRDDPGSFTRDLGRLLVTWCPQKIEISDR